MADNATTQSATLATVPSGTIIATDQIPGTLEHVQLIKLVDGTADSTARIPGDATNGLLVNVSNASLAVTGTFWQATQPISAASLPLPTGAATAAKQPALGTAGTASADVITVQGIASMTPIAVSGTFWQATQPVSGTVTVSNPGTEYTEDAIAPADPIGRALTFVQVASPADRTAAAGDWVAGTGTKYGAQLVQLTTSTGSFIDSVGGGSQYAEDAAHASGDIGTIAMAVRTDTPTQRAGTDGDYSVLETDKDGRLWTNTGTLRANKVPQFTTITSSTAETTIGTAVASTYLDLYLLTLTNSGSVGTKVTIKDSTAGTTRLTFYVPPLSTVGFSVDINSALAQATVNNNWTATCSASTASLEVGAYFVKNT